jgi:hypothetical protein
LTGGKGGEPGGGGSERKRRKEPFTFMRNCGSIYEDIESLPSRPPWAYGKWWPWTPKVSPGPAMPDPSIPSGRATPEMALLPIRVARPQAGRPVGILYPFEDPTPYAYVAPSAPPPISARFLPLLPNLSSDRRIENCPWANPGNHSNSPPHSLQPLHCGSGEIIIAKS